MLQNNYIQFKIVPEDISPWLGIVPNLQMPMA